MLTPTLTRLLAAYNSYSSQVKSKSKREKRRSVMLMMLMLMLMMLMLMLKERNGKLIRQIISSGLRTEDRSTTKMTAKMTASA